MFSCLVTFYAKLTWLGFLPALSFCCTSRRSAYLVVSQTSCILFSLLYIWLLVVCKIFLCVDFLLYACRDYLSPSDIIANYPHLIVVGTGLAFGFLVVRHLSFFLSDLIVFLPLWSDFFWTTAQIMWPSIICYHCFLFLEDNFGGSIFWYV